MGLEWWQWALWLALWFALAGGLCVAGRAAFRFARDDVERHVTRALSSREQVRKSLDLVAGEDR